ncbi:hypothetical protein KZ483_14435 [Paenibacillus sp. sptzw28]|uniref:hypothetical protein n=1 Tax=Paenibacillus sp. sptzw28 TaxID=715179 RepID=UPI001C6EB9E7|nr:hypothetical protein [Paenibacillus sp. sptzw28]QYR19164.1 hypothetical protein KZ483_14435 [Paenibacillus sp. sptzw28]
MAKRLKAMGNPRYSKGFEPQEHYDALSIPYSFLLDKNLIPFPTESAGIEDNERISSDSAIRNAWDIVGTNFPN